MSTTLPGIDSLISVTRAAWDGVRGQRSRDVSGWVVSFPKAGRTWLMFLYVYYGVYGLLGDRADEFIENELPFTFRLSKSKQFRDLLSRHEGGTGSPRPVPLLAFTHALPPRTPYYALDLDLPESAWAESRVLLLVRDPRDTVVSFFHHTGSRGIRGTRARDVRDVRPRNVPLPEDMELSEFIRSESLGVRAIVSYLNQAIAQAESNQTSFEVLFYEDMLADAAGQLEKLLGFFGVREIDESAIRRAVERASLTNLQGRERQRRARQGRDITNLSAFRFRRGEAGSHMDELTADDVLYLDRVIDTHLHPRFARYRSESAAAVPELDASEHPQSQRPVHRERRLRSRSRWRWKRSNSRARGA